MRSIWHPKLYRTWVLCCCLMSQKRSISQSGCPDIPNHMGCRFCALVWCLKRDPIPKADVLNDVPNQIGHPYCPNHIGCQLCTLFRCLKRDPSPKLMSYIWHPKSHNTSALCPCPMSQMRSISQNWHLIWCLKSCHTSFFSFSPPSCALLPCLKRYTYHKTDVQYDVSNHMEHQFCALVQCFKRDPSPKTIVLCDAPNHMGCQRKQFLLCVPMFDVSNNIHILKLMSYMTSQYI